MFIFTYTAAQENFDLHLGGHRQNNSEHKIKISAN